jgi:hypothetical protein
LVALQESSQLRSVSQFPSSFEHEHDDEYDLIADFGVSFSVERYAALGTMSNRVSV